ncbi:hypothetical protein GCM10022381_29900 [Leifsonia kafniensis]|uniref:Uncharacterized protein n=1 Tax=Leifsonia kafniensis TaxID=475957 RepID=A0ABP7KRX5_9MICO
MGEFARSEPRNNAISYIRGLLSDEERKNSWTLSERAGQGTPDGMQRLLLGCFTVLALFSAGVNILDTVS